MKKILRLSLILVIFSTLVYWGIKQEIFSNIKHSQAQVECVDKTPNNSCSQNPTDANPDSWGQPYFCENGKLVEKCDLCGCFGEQKVCNFPGRGDCTAFSHIRTGVVNYGASKDEADNLWYAKHFDLFNGAGIDILRKYTNAWAISYDNYFDFYEDYPRGSGKGHYLRDVKCAGDKFCIEEMYMHYGKNTTYSAEGKSMVIPGWNPADDTNGDLVRDIDPPSDPNATARYKSESRVRDYYLRNNPDGTPAYSQRFIANVSSERYRQFNLEYQKQRLGGTKFSGAFVDNSGSGWPTTAGYVLEYPESKTDTSRLAPLWRADYAKTFQLVHEQYPLKVQVPNCMNMCIDDYLYYIDGVITEWYLREGGGHKIINLWATETQKAQDRKKPFRMSAIDSDMTANPTRSRIFSLAVYYLFKNDYTYYRAPGDYANPNNQWFDAMAFNIGQPLGDYFTFATGTDPSDSQSTYTIYAREFTNVLVLVKNRPNEASGFQEFARAVNTAALRNDDDKYIFPTDSDLIVKVNGGSQQTITIPAGSYRKTHLEGEKDMADLADIINQQLQGATAYGNQWPTARLMRIDSNITGPTSEIHILGGSANDILKFRTTPFTTSGTTHTLPESYYPLKSDGTLDTLTNQIYLYNSQGAILIKESAATGIELTKTVDRLTSSSGEILTYNISYRNRSQTETYTDAKLEDPIPNGTTYVENSATNNGIFSNNKITWDLGNLLPGTTGQVQFQVRVE